MVSYQVAALVTGRIGLVRSLGREGVPVTLTVPARYPFVTARYSRYSRHILPVPHFEMQTDAALECLETWAKGQASPPVVMCNGESDVLLFARHRERLSQYFRIPLATTALLEALVHKGKFAALAQERQIPSPQTLIPRSKDECMQLARQIGYPCVLKPVNQRHWHKPGYVQATKSSKALLLRNEPDLIRTLERYPAISGSEMIQEYIPGPDDQHFDFHCYIDQQGSVTGSLVAQKIRTYPIHFGMGSYVRLVHEPSITQLCLEALHRIGYVGAANINLKRHAETGRDYILEINPRFSVWTAFDQACGLNLALHQYRDALGFPVTSQQPAVNTQRWLWFGHDLKAMRQYRKQGELTFWKWCLSLFSEPGRVEFQVFAWDDPFVLPIGWWISVRSLARRIGSAVVRRLLPSRFSSRGNANLDPASQKNSRTDLSR